jgi:hypothetical protein
MRTDPIVDEVRRVRQELLDEFGGDVDAVIDEANRRLLNGEFSEFKIVVRSPAPRVAPKPGAE